MLQRSNMDKLKTQRTGHNATVTRIQIEITEAIKVTQNKGNIKQFAEKILLLLLYMDKLEKVFFRLSLSFS